MALADALARATAGQVVAKTTCEFSSRNLPAFALKRHWIAPEKLCRDCTPPWPDVVVSCGTRASSAALAIKAGTGAKVANILRPAHGIEHYDTVVSPGHDRLNGRNVVNCIGSLVSPGVQSRMQTLAAHGLFASIPGQKTALLLGGPNRSFKFDLKVCRNLVGQVIKAAEAAGMRILAVHSRRTPSNVVKETQKLLTPNDYLWNGKDANPYWDAIAASETVAVTGDSISMLSEACSSGRPVYLLPLPLGPRLVSSKFLRFHQQLTGGGFARLFSGTLEPWKNSILDEMPVVAKKTKELLGIAP